MKWKRILKGAALAVPLLFFAWFELAYWTSTNDCEHITASPNNPMQAILSCEYGVENLQLRNIEKPAPNENELLVRVHAASLNFINVGIISGLWPLRPLTGWRKPRNIRFGTDFAGIVEAVGKNVANFKPGDEVFGATKGAVADYVCVKADRFVVMKPNNVTFEQAGAVGIAGLTALQGLRDAGRVQAGQQVLINGASGGIGTFAIQIAKAYGAEVTAVCSTRNVDLVKSIGADRAIDYTSEDFTKSGQHYDVIFDIIRNHSFAERRRALKPNGICVLAGIGPTGVRSGVWGQIAGNFADVFKSKFITQKFVFHTTKLNREDLDVMRELMQAGKVMPVIDRTYPISETQAAVRYLETGHARGKVVIKVN